ncbi:hypothetical protein O0I10_000114 [Lichtheimia ornata]|uniref:Homeobox domain-containing protein n=1 Tax=Lichtheimia ornata TaxID=688661 RepID=A0AAD8DJ11_9FUNG|nr:uncharacterized protein O0I10_000114 [Lichtheimia ornata]KAJ8663840.1 hypothetical protein O0I10_000114 [Lichtheimia ornata]
MDLNDDFDLSEFLILDGEDDTYTSPCGGEPQKPVVAAFSPLTPPGTPFDIHIADIKKEEEKSNDCPWPSTWDAASDMIHNHHLQQQPAGTTSDTVCPLSIMLSPPTSSSSTSYSTPPYLHKQDQKESIRLFPDLPNGVKTKTIKIPSCQRDAIKRVCPKVATPPPIKKPRNIRTPTSYDTKTSEFLKRMFFETYVQNKKLTKEQRQKIIERTDLDSRKITYWFSNHKRRSKDQLETYARLLRQGTITTYDEFVQFCKDHDVPGFQPQSNTQTTL